MRYYAGPDVGAHKVVPAAVSPGTTKALGSSSSMTANSHFRPCSSMPELGGFYSAAQHWAPNGQSLLCCIRTVHGDVPYIQAGQALMRPCHLCEGAWVMRSQEPAVLIGLMPLVLNS